MSLPEDFPLIPFDDAARLPATPPDLIKGLLPSVGMGLLWGPSKTGKTFLALDIAFHVTLGHDYRGRRVQKGPVVYCAFEGESGFRKRMMAIRTERMPPGIVPQVPFYLQPKTMDFAKRWPDLVRSVKSGLGGVRPKMVILDTLNRSLVGSESSDEDMAGYIQAVDGLRQALNCFVMIVHHCGNDNSRPRGHSSLTAAVDVQLAIEMSRDGLITIRRELARDDAAGLELASRLRPVIVGADEDGDPITSCVVEPADLEAKPRGRPKMTPNDKLILRALKDALAAAGSEVALPGIPAGTVSVPVQVWRTKAYDILSAEKLSAKRVAFRRAQRGLHVAGIIGIHDEKAWIASDEHRTPL